MYRFESPGIVGNLPVFYEKIKSRMDFPLSRMTYKELSLHAWRSMARPMAIQLLNTPPLRGNLSWELVSEEDRGSYTAKKVLVNLTAYSKVCGYLLVPKGEGPFPAVLLSHDHGAMHQIGKEKVTRPFHVSKSTQTVSQQWVDECYGGRHIGDELCLRGYVCLSFDAINWGERGGAGGGNQQAFATAMFLLGSSYAGHIAWEDMYAAAFLAELPFVDRTRIAAAGLSMGAYRSFQLGAYSPHIAASVCICWMTTVKGVCTPGNDQMHGQSAYSMLHPGMSRYLDYADVASLACPKPMLHYSGTQDTLFPLDSVEEAYEKMRAVWAYEGAEDKLETRMWDSPHQFSLAMQEAAFSWLDGYLRP